MVRLDVIAFARAHVKRHGKIRSEKKNRKKSKHKENRQKAAKQSDRKKDGMCVFYDAQFENSECSFVNGSVYTYT